jgi:hypothetical protein
MGKAPAVEAVSAAAVLAVPLVWPGSLTPEAAEAALARSQEAYGFCGVRLAAASPEPAFLLVTPGSAIPAGHPLAAGGLARSSAGLLAFTSAAGVPEAAAGRWLVQALSARLLGRADCLEAQSNPLPSPGALPPGWLAAWGFRPLGAPAGRYRLDLKATARPAGRFWARWFRARPAWNPQPAPAARSGQ